MEIRELSNKDETKWNEFVREEKSSTIYHLSEWRKIIENAYGHKSFYLLAEEDGKIKGILPLISIRSKFFGSKLVSLPFLYCAGICSSSSYASEKLIEEAKNIANSIGCNYLELRGLYQDDNAVANNTQFVTSILKLRPNPDDTYKSLPKGKREDIRRAKKRGNFVAIWNDDAKCFYKVYSQIMKDLGTPMHSLKFFADILDTFPNNSKILSVQREGELIASYLLLTYRDVMIANSGGSIRAFKNYYPGDFSFWTAIEYACMNGFQYFDFGRSTSGSSNHIFKQKYNCETKQLYYQYYLNNSAIPSYDLSEPKHRIFVKFWKKVPINISKLAGPMLRRHIP